MMPVKKLAEVTYVYILITTRGVFGATLVHVYTVEKPRVRAISLPLY